MNARIDQGPSPLQSAQNWSTQVEGDTSAASQLPGATLRTSTSPSALINSQEIFKSFVQGEVDKMIGSVSGSAAQMLGEIASDTLNAIMDKTFGRLQGELVASQGQGMTSDPIAMMQSAHTEATELLDMLKESTSKQSFNTTPQLVKGEDGYRLIRTAPQIENLVLQGGGAKGVGNPGALREMREAGVLDGLKSVAGTSAGALTAVSIACGQPQEELEALAFGDATALLKGKSKEAAQLYPDIDMSSKYISFKNVNINPFSGSFNLLPELQVRKGGLNPQQAAPMLIEMDKMLCKEVGRLVAGQSMQQNEAMVDAYIASPQGQGKTKEEVLERLIVLANPDMTQPRTGKMVTFNDMQMLHQMAPTQFKEIILTGWDGENQTALTFQAGEKYGDLPVAYAARASMAHPGIATGIILPGDTNPTTDGGIGTNLPTEAFYGGDMVEASKDTTGDQATQEIRARTAAMIFDDEGKAYKAMHGKHRGMDDLPSGGGFQGFLAQNRNYNAVDVQDANKAQGAGPNTFVVAHGKVGTFGTGLIINPQSRIDRHIERAEASSRELMVEQLQMREGQAYALEVDSPQDAFTLLSRDEIQSIVDDGPPIDDGSMTPENFDAANDFYYLAVEKLFEPT